MEKRTRLLFSFWVLKCLACVMRARQDQRKNNEPPARRARQQKTKTNEHQQTACFLAFAGETKRDDTNYSFQLYTHTHTHRLKEIEREKSI